MGVPAGSLPAPYSAGFAGGYMVMYTVVLHLGGGDALYMVTKRDLTVAPLSLTVKYGSTVLTPLYDYYRPQYLAARVDEQPVDGIGDIDFAMNIDDNGGLAARSEAVIRLLNMPLNGERLDWLLSMFDIENYDLEIWEGYIPLSGTLQIDTDMILRFRGVVRDGATYDHRTLSFRGYDRRDVENNMVPKYLINKTDTAVPDEHYLGKPFPLPCGDYNSENVAIQSVGTADMYAHEMGFIHALPTVRPGQAPTFYIADHAIATLVSVDNPLFFRTPEAKNWIIKMLPTGITDWYTYSTDANGRAYVFVRIALGDIYVFPALLGVNNSDGTFDDSDLAIILNDDLSDYVTVAYPNVFTISVDKLDVAGDMVSAEDSGGYGGATDFSIFVANTSRTGSVNLKIYDRELGTTVDKGVINSDKWSTGYDMPAGQATFDKLATFDVEFRPQSGGSIRIHKLYLKARVRPSISFYDFTTRDNTRSFGYQRRGPIALTPPEKSIHTDGFFVSGFGAKFGSWITDGGRSTGYAPGDVITNAAYYIEFLLRDYADVDGSRIDTDAIDLIGNTTDGTRKDWACKGVNMEQKEVFEIIRQVAHEHALKLAYDHDSVSGLDVHRLTAIPHRDDDVALTITAAEIMRDDAGVPMVQITKTPQSQIVNAYSAKFKFNFTLGDFSDELYIDDLNNDGDIETSFADDTGSPRLNSYVGWCEGSVQTYRRRVMRQVEFNYIDEPATAELRLKTYLDWYAWQRMVVKMQVLRTLDTVGLRRGDVIIIDHPLLNDLHQNVTKFVVDRIGYPPIGETMQPFIVVECQEIPNQNTGLRVVRGLAHEVEQSVMV